MATRLHFRAGAADSLLTFPTIFGVQLNSQGGSASWWRTRALVLNSVGSTVETATAATVTGPTNGLSVRQGADTNLLEFISEPLAAAVTISGTVSFNIWALESSMNANAAVGCRIQRVDGTTLAVTDVVAASVDNAELGTSAAAMTWTATPTSTAFAKGDRIRITVYFDDSGTMATGFTCTFRYGHNVANTAESWVEFTETFTFMTDGPVGSVVGLKDAASDVATADVDKEMWTDNGSGVTTKVTNTADAPQLIQWTDGAGGTAITWFSKQLTAFTLTGPVRCNIRAHESNAAANATIRVELAVVDNDGSNASVFGVGVHFNELGTSEAVCLVHLAGPDISVSSGQRLRLRVYVDDHHDGTNTGLVTGHTCTLSYNTSSLGGAGSGDTWIQLQESISQFTAGKAPVPPTHDRVIGFQSLLHFKRMNHGTHVHGLSRTGRIGRFGSVRLDRNSRGQHAHHSHSRVGSVADERAWRRSRRSGHSRRSGGYRIGDLWFGW